MPHSDPPATFVRRSQWVARLVTFAIAGTLFYQYRLFFHDDAFISLRYAQTFLNGGGLCWNPGERVEGYTNFLFVILTAAMGKCGIDLVVASRIIGIGSYLLLMVFSVRRFMRSADSDSVDWLALVPVVIAATALPVIIWTLGGLETTLFTLFVTIGVVQFAEAMSDNRRSLMAPGLWFGLATLCRPDGIIFVVCGLAMVIAKSLLVDRRIDRRLWSYLLVTAVLIVPHEIWRYSYYGHWLPNTFLIKGTNLDSAAIHGWQYVKDFSAAIPFLPLMLLVAVLFATVKRTWRLKSIWYLVVICAFSAYVRAIGGDHMPGFRLFAPLIPICGYLLFELLSEMKVLERSAFKLAIICAILLLCAGQLVFPAESYQRAKVRDGAAFLGEQVGKYINVNWPAGSVVALNTAGSTPYCAPNLRFIDMLGLNDTTIASRSNVPVRTKIQEWPGHQKGDGLYILSRKPDYIIIGPANGDYANNFPWFLSDYELGGSEQFLREYEPVKVIISATAPGYKHYTESALGALRFVYYQRKK